MTRHKVDRILALGKRHLPVLLVAVGVGAIALAFAADLLRIGDQAGWGDKQKTLALVGLVILAGGVFLGSPLGKRCIKELSLLSAKSKRPVPVPFIAIWFGLFAGLSDVAILSHRKLIQGKWIYMSPHFAWMIPLGDAFLVVVPGAILFLVSRRWSKSFSLRVTVLVSAFLGFSSVLFLFPRLHIYAALLLAAGLAVQVSRVVGRHPGVLYWLVRRTTPIMTATVVLLFASLWGWSAFAERRAVDELPPASPNAPNVLLIVLDTVRAQNLSLHGYDRLTTPQLERIAEKGVWFERAFSTAPWTIPSHASMFTGRWHHELSADWATPLDDTYPTLAEVFASQGYHTVGFVANLMAMTYEQGLNRGFVHYEDHRISPGQTILRSSLVRTIATHETVLRITNEHRLYITSGDAEQLNTDFLSWLSRHSQRPFFAFLNYFDAHDPYQPPESFDTAFGPASERGNQYAVERSLWSPSENQAEIDAYDGAISYLDDQIGRLFDELEQRGLVENTLIIVTSDHGEEFGEHGAYYHGETLYLPALHVPLVILFPSGVPAGTSVDQPVTLRDLPATVVELAGLRDGTRFPGRSLARYWEGEHDSDSLVDPLLAQVTVRGEGSMQSLLDAQYHYIKNPDGSEELYDIEDDPWEQQDLTSYEQGQRMLGRFRTMLKAVRSHDQSTKVRQWVVWLLPDSVA